MEGTRMVGTITRLRLVLPAVAMVAALAGCDAARQAQDAGRGVDKARQCATLVADLAGINLDLSPGTADDAARKLDERARNIDQTDVRNAAETLADRLERLSDTAANSTPAERQQAVDDVTQAATRLASACNVPLDQLVSTG